LAKEAKIDVVKKMKEETWGIGLQEAWEYKEERRDEVTKRNGKATKRGWTQDSKSRKSYIEGFKGCIQKYKGFVFTWFPSFKLSVSYEVSCRIRVATSLATNWHLKRYSDLDMVCNVPSADSFASQY
jgi:hypothetical protein